MFNLRKLSKPAVTVLLASTISFGMLSTLSAQNSNDRADRIRQQQERVQRLLLEAKAKREAAEAAQVKAIQPGAQQAQQSPPPTQPTQNNAAGQPAAPGAPGRAAQPPVATNVQPGQPIPTGPVQPVRATPPIQPGQTPPPQASAPQAPRSESRMVYLFNPLDSAVRVGETFETNIVVETREGQIDELSFLLKYPVDHLNPLAFDHSALDYYIDDSLTYEFDPDAGTIYVTAKLKEPTKLSQTPIVTVTWEALKPTQGAPITYEFGKDKTTALKFNGQDLIGTLPGAQDGVINTTVLIKSPQTRTAVTKLGRNELLISAKIDSRANTKNLDIYLDTEVESVAAAEEFKIDLLLDNPDNAPFDRLRAYLQFNPEDVEVLDTDKNNWIKKGVNIADGFARDNFKFNYHRSNYADNEKGIIVYDMAAVGTPLTTSGKFATVHLRAKREIPKTNIVLVANTPGMAPTTDVSFHKISLLADKPDSISALDGIPLKISGTLSEEQQQQQISDSVQSGYNPFRSELARRMQNKQ